MAIRHWTTGLRIGCVTTLVALGGACSSSGGNAAGSNGDNAPVDAGASLTEVGPTAGEPVPVGGAGGSGGTGGNGGTTEACALDGACPPGARCDVTTGACRPACRNDFECGDSARCEPAGGYCVPLPRCDSAGADCGVDGICTCHGVCEPLVGARCRTDLQCPVSEYCDACIGACKPRVAPCGRCSTDEQACERPTDLCLPFGAAGLPTCLRGCVGQPTCDALGPGYTCREVAAGAMACVPDAGECRVDAPCLGDVDCAREQICGDTGRCQDGCSGDAECPNGNLCVGGRCVPPCGDAAPCTAPAECAPDGRCRVPGGCATSADCPERETHCDLSTHLCAPGCERDADCLSAADECVDGRCRERGCTGNYQCAFEQICDLASGACEPAGGRHCEPGCDPMVEGACGAGNACVGLQDRDGNDLGQFCFEACRPSPNECPQGYQCVDLAAQSSGSEPPPDPPPEPMFMCIRRCDQEPVQ
jgi:hypothetical protein